tara:strand:- start:73 stop:600 length:528 start_codon:yes stop_codon:yes gene_type:complete
MNLPNILSISRIFLFVLIILLFENGFFLFSLFTFIIAALTDYFDGYFARKNNQTSKVGSLLDLIADKIFVSSLLIWMTFYFDNLIILISSILIISREISISNLRLFIITESQQLTEVKSDFLGKFKTTFQMVSIGFILASPYTSDTFFKLSLGLIFLSSLISWVSFLSYLKKWTV